MHQVALIGPTDRREIERLALRIEERGGGPLVLDSRLDPAIEFNGDEVRACGVDLSLVRGVYVADLGIVSPRTLMALGASPEEALAASVRRLAAWNALLERLALTARVVNPPTSHDLHALKPFESAVYARSGLPTPWTLATSDPAALLQLPDRVALSWVTKGLVGGYSHTARAAKPATLQAARDNLADGPRLFQELVEGVNARAYVLAGRVLGAAEVIPLDGAEIDSRREGARIRRITLPPAVERCALAAAARWGMPFAAVDFMHEAASSRFLILECNSAPFFVVFEGRAGVDVAGPLADYLLGRAPASQPA